MEGFLSMATWCGAVFTLGFYGAYIFFCLMALRYGRRWLHSKRYAIPRYGMVSGSVNGVENGHSLSSELAEHPGVSVLKPVVGCDPNLKTNLEGFFRLNYPKYELLFCIGEKYNAPSYSIIAGLMSKYPDVDAKVFQGGELVGVNPKINNMMPGYKAAKYNLLWICDSSLLALPYTLTELVSHSLRPEVALVHQLPYIVTVDGFAGCLDKVYFGTQHSRVYLLANMVGENCANGMSWLIKKRVLEEEGGLSAFAEYLAEDFFIGKALWTKGWKFVLSTIPALQNPGVRSLSIYKKRIIRWGRLRATMMPWPGLVEPFTECLGLGLLGSLAAGYLLGASFLLTLLFMVAHCAAWFTFDVILMRTIENGPVGPLHHIFLAWCLREVWTFPLFIAGIWSREVAWKDQKYKLQFGGKAVKVD